MADYWRVFVGAHPKKLATQVVSDRPDTRGPTMERRSSSLLDPG
jgi:hypothetical protein